MAETFVVIPGRTSRQGTSLNVGKHTPEYQRETSTVWMSLEDWQRLGLKPGARLRLRSAHGEAEAWAEPGKPGELPAGALFLAYGHTSSLLMGGDTHGTGMPDSKGLDVTVEVVSAGPPAVQ